jgi:hypothetical protein
MSGQYYSPDFEVEYIVPDPSVKVPQIGDSLVEGIRWKARQLCWEALPSGSWMCTVTFTNPHEWLHLN